MAAQKTLLQQVQETEAESCELHEFMQLEKNALVDALREAETEVRVMAAHAQTDGRDASSPDFGTLTTDDGRPLTPYT